MRLTLDGLGHRFGDGPWLFTDVCADLADGQLCAITGPSGSGKSTLLSIIAGWQTPAAGRVAVAGGAGVSWVAQNPVGVAPRSALDHVVLPLLARGLSRREAQPAARSALARFRLDAVVDQPFGRLSGGEAQRLMLARALVTGADLLLVDEPTAQLDRHSAATVIATLGELAGAGRVVVVATHDPDVAGACGAVLDLGRSV